MNTAIDLYDYIVSRNLTIADSEGSVRSSFFDLSRVTLGKLVEHWDATEAIPPAQ